MSELLVVSMIDPFELGKRFTRWDRHMTILPWFDAEIERAKEIVCEVTNKFGNIRLEVKGEAMFGPKSDVLVKLIERSEQLKFLHDDLIGRLVESGAKINGRYTGGQYRPHVSLRHGMELDAKRIDVYSLQIAEALPQGYRRIIASYDLKDKNAS